MTDLSSSRHSPVEMIDYSFIVYGSDPTLYLNTVVAANVPTSRTADAHHTSYFEIFVPDGIHWTSASGAFMSQTLSDPIPEPSTWWLLVSGGVALATLKRRRRHAILRNPTGT